MEEKERFELFGEHCIKDNNPDARPQLLDAYVACVILNEQDQEIADLQHKLKVAEKALELACKYNIPDDEHSHITLRFSDTGVQVESWQELKEYALKQAEKEIKGE